MVTRRGFVAGGSAAIIAGAAPRLAWSRTEADVVIIGAGLAGLNAARICEASGLSVVVVEAENRIGGRLHTLDDLPSRPEAGGIQIGSGYTRLHAIAEKLGIALTRDAGAGAGAVQASGNLYSIHGQSSIAATWADDPANLLSDNEKAIEPAALLRHYASALPGFASPPDWLTASPDLDISVEQTLRNAGASDEAQRLIETNFNGSSLAEMSQIHLARSFAIFRTQPGPVSTIADGAQRLPEAMAGTLKGELILGEPVRAIMEEPNGVTMRLSDYSITARRAICTIPFAALRAIPMQSGFPPELARMVTSLPYTRASFAYISAQTPFWREDGFPETLWTDDPLIGRIFVLGEHPPMLKLWTTGGGADMLDRMPTETANRMIVERIEKMRPAARGQIKILRHYSWQKSPYARGIYHHIGTGMAADLAKAALWQGRNLHFAGEHLAIANSGMEGALESGERAAMRVLTQA